MAAPALAPVTRQVSSRTAAAPDPSGPERRQPLAAAVAQLPVLDASGRRVPFGWLFRERRAVVVFVRVSAGPDVASWLGWKLLTKPRLGAQRGRRTERGSRVQSGVRRVLLVVGH